MDSRRKNNVRSIADVSALVVDTTFDDVQMQSNMARDRALREVRSSKIVRRAADAANIKNCETEIRFYQVELSDRQGMIDAYDMVIKSVYDAGDKFALPSDVPDNLSQKVQELLAEEQGSYDSRSATVRELMMACLEERASLYEAQQETRAKIRDAEENKHMYEGLVQVHSRSDNAPPKYGVVENGNIGCLKRLWTTLKDKYA